MPAFEIADEDLKDLNDKVILITGGSSGIGLATINTILTHSPNAHIISADLNPPPTSHPRVLFVPTDVISWPAQRSLFQTALSKHPRIDHVFANAGITAHQTYLEDDLEPHAAIHSHPLENLTNLAEPSRKVLDVNLTGVIYTCKLALFVFRHQPPAPPPPSASAFSTESTTCSLTITASISSFTRFGMSDYAVSKHAVLGLMRALVPHTWPHVPVRVNAVAPAWTETRIFRRETVEGAGLRVQGPEVVGRAVGWLMGGETRSGEEGDGGGLKRRRHGLVVYVDQGRYVEMEEGLLEAATMGMGETESAEEARRMLEVHDVLLGHVGRQQLREQREAQGQTHEEVGGEKL